MNEYDVKVKSWIELKRAQMKEKKRTSTQQACSLDRVESLHHTVCRISTPHSV